LKLKHDKLLSNVAFNCNLRPSTKAEEHSCFDAVMNGDETGVGRCSFTPD